MTIELTIHTDRKLTYFRFSDRISVADCAQAFNAYVNHPHFDPSYLMLSDTRALTGIDASFLGIVMAVERLHTSFGKFPDPVRSVIHAADDVIFGMARMMQQICEPLSELEFEICRSEAEALTLAGLRETSFDALAEQLGILEPAA